MCALIGWFSAWGGEWGGKKGEEEPSEGKDDSRKRGGGGEAGKGTRKPGHHWSIPDYERLQEALGAFVNGSRKFTIDYVYSKIPGTLDIIAFSSIQNPFFDLSLHKTTTTPF